MQFNVYSFETNASFALCFVTISCNIAAKNGALWFRWYFRVFRAKKLLLDFFARFAILI